MRLLHITDSHGTAKAPRERQDIYYISFLKKFIELKNVVKQCSINVVIHTGDLFHSACISNKFAGQVSEIIKSMEVPFYVVPGNHDIEGYTIDTIDQTMLGLLAKTGTVSLLTRSTPVQFMVKQHDESFVIGLSGQEYYADIDNGNNKDFQMQQTLCDFNILAIHGYITDMSQHPNIKHTLAKNIITDSDIILSGHYHCQFHWQGNNADVYNPGSMMRIERNQYNKKHIPQYGILEVELDDEGNIQYDYQFHAFKDVLPSSQVFDYLSQAQEKTISISLDKFKQSLNDTMANINSVSKIEDMIQTIGKKKNKKGEHLYSKEVINEAQYCYDIASHSVTDLDIKQGYYQTAHTKKISKVILHNFQSHEDTTIEFHDGMNIIMGESNNGKTSILRGILWAIDNEPSGKDFIMADKNECSVQIIFDDGTYIIRERTRKNTGSYKIQYYDEDTHKMEYCEFKGFANDDLVNIDNVHQMPKISITKDIIQHLNVQSQLDPPFLLTESSANKAAAIGRITGTHIIDMAVKEIAKQTRNISATNNTFTKQIEKLEDDLKALEDTVAVHVIATTYEAIYNELEAINIKIDSLNRLIADIDAIEYTIGKEKYNYNQYQCIIKLIPVIRTAMASQEKLQKISDIMISIQQSQNNIAMQERYLTSYQNDVKSNGIYKELIPVVQMALKTANTITELDKKYNTITRFKEDIDYTEQQMAFNKQFYYMVSGIVSFASTAMNRCNNIIKAYNRVVVQNVSVESTKKYIDEKSSIIKDIKQQISDKIQERTKYIIDNNYCPCCGQNVPDEKTADNITTFLKGASL